MRKGAFIGKALKLKFKSCITEQKGGTVSKGTSLVGVVNSMLICKIEAVKRAQKLLGKVNILKRARSKLRTAERE